METTLTFVEHSHGDVEGTIYDNVILSDGLMGLKVKNGTDSKSLESLKEGDKVAVTFRLKGSKDLQPRLLLTAISKAK